MKHVPAIEIDDLTAVIRESIAAHKNDDEQLPPVASASENKIRSVPELKLQPDFQPNAGDRYHVNDLLQYHDRAFLYAAYQAILKRRPDEAEFLRDRKRMQRGAVNKIDLLATLRLSPEGRAKKVAVQGLAAPALIRRIGRLPVIGYLLNLGIAFLRLPKQVSDQRQFAAYTLAQNQQIADFVNAISARVAECRTEVSRLAETVSKQAALIDSNHAQLDELLDTRFGELATINNRIEVAQQELENRIEVNKDIVITRLESEVGRRLELRQMLLDQQQSLVTLQNKLHAEIERLSTGLQHARTELTLQRRHVDTPPQQASQKPAAADTHQLDALYAALEDRFRGSREEIKERFRLYLPYVKEANPVVDLGCGRGEWLEILSEAKITASGVDRNQVQIEQCRAHSLDVVEGDFIAHLKSLPDGSTGAVTGFHIIEHISTESLARLLDEVMRVLRPGGVVIFETPNPENVIVGANFFYMDPTHRHPLPSQLMEFLLQTRGFDSIEVLNLHPWDADKLHAEGEIADRLNHYFYGPMDYAILGWKVGP